MNQYRQSASKNDRPFEEWVVGALSATIVVVLMVFLGYRALLDDASTPDLHVVIERVDQLDGRTVAAFAVENRGSEAAAAIMVSAQSTAASGSELPKQLEFDYIAANAVRRGAFVFAGPVASGDISIEIGSYAEP